MIWMENRHIQYWIIGLTKHLQKMIKFSDISGDSNLGESNLCTFVVYY